MDVEMEKRKFLNLCGKRDRALLSGEKRMTLGDMERLTYLTEFFFFFFFVWGGGGASDRIF